MSTCVARPAALTVVAAESARAIKDWLAVPEIVFAGDPAWVAPLKFLERRRVSPKHAPFFTFGEAKLFLAYRGDKPVGRISAQINSRHLAYHRDGCGHFGFFACCDDDDAAQALLDAAALWLRARGMSRMVGPMSFTINEECGCLVSGFNTPPAVLMPHGRPWIGRLLEGAGLTKEVDIFAYRVATSKMPVRIYEIAELARRSRGVSIRQLDMTRYDEEVRTVIDIFNDAWSGNWGFVPFGAAEIDALLAEMRPVFRGHYGRFVLFDDKPVGLMLGMPNINQVIAPFNGSLLPFNWLKLWWALQRESIRTTRVPLLGIRKTFQSTPIGGQLVALLVADFLSQMRRHEIEWAEFSWVLETNQRMNRLATLVAGPPVKTYRIYGKAL